MQPYLGLRISFDQVCCMARAASVPGLWTLGFLLLCGVCVWVRVAVGCGFRLPGQSWPGSWAGVFGYGLWCRPSLAGWGLWCSWLGLGFGLHMGRAWLRARSAWTPPFPVPVCGVGVRAGVWVSAAPRNSLGGCRGVCVLVPPCRVVSCPSWLGVLCRGWVFVRAPRLFPTFPGWGVLCGRACWAWVSAVPRPSWFGCWGVFFFCVSCFGFVVSVAGCPCPGRCGPCPPISSLSGWVAGSFFFQAWCVSARCGCPLSRRAAFPALVLPVLAGWSPCAPLGALSSLPSGSGVWLPLVVLAGGFVAVGRSPAPPPLPPSFSFGGGLPVPPSAFPRLANALARIQCGLPGCCWWLLSAWPCPGPMHWVGYAHVGLSAPSCRVRSWLCRLGGCARRLCVALG